MISEGVHDISAEEYHADLCHVPSLSSGIAKLLLRQTPQHAWFNHPRLNPKYEREHSEKFDIGNAAHSLILNDPKAFVIIEAPDWRTKGVKELREQARAEGKIPLLSGQWVRTSIMVRIAREQLKSHADASDAFTNGKPEQSLIWKEGETWFRARLDWLPKNCETFDDYKTSETANPEAWSRIAFNVGHDLQAAFYLRGIRALGIAKHPKFRFIVQEVEPPYALSVVTLSDDAIALADRRIETAIGRWRWCLENNSWPGYPATTVEIGAPPWAENNLAESEVREAAAVRHAGLANETELLAMGMKFHSPL